MASRISRPRTIDGRSILVHWSKYADGTWWRLAQGPDFTQDPRRALKAARTWGWRNGYAVAGSVSGPSTIDVKLTKRTT